jgi:hypothetical protein|tara:strand:- start:144 stop:830 length:687 start_codon:yes stop_codon:yes gene_type:complete
MQNPFKLIVEDVDVDSFQYLIEQKNPDTAPKYYIEGPMIMVDEKNENDRVYEGHEMEPAVEKYIKEFVDSNRALGEMEHPNSPDVNLERACDKMVSLRKEGNVYIGKAVCLSTPMGKLQESLIRDGVKLGKSTRCLGQLIENNGTNYVKQPNIRAIDTVHNPSGQGKTRSCFVNGILENKEWIINYDNGNEELYDSFEGSLATLPKKDVDRYLRENIIRFINSLTITR